MSAFPFIGQLLAKAIVKQASTLSAAAAINAATEQHRHSLYVLKVLEAPAGARAAVKAEAALSNSPGQKQLVAILTAFEWLSPSGKADFIVAYKSAATVNTQGVRQIALHTVFQGNHVPPLYEP